jgi:hypothetical protein
MKKLLIILFLFLLSCDVNISSVEIIMFHSYFNGYIRCLIENGIYYDNKYLLAEKIGESYLLNVGNIYKSDVDRLVSEITNRWGNQ